MSVIIARNVGEDAIPERHAEALRVRLGHRREPAFAAALPCEIEREPDHALRAMTREHGRLHGDFVRPAGVEHSADLRVLPFRVLADDDEVDVARLLVGQGAPNARIEHRRTHARVLIELAPNRQEQAVEGEVVLQPGIADGAEEDGVEGPQTVDGVGRHHASVLEVVIGPPGERLPRHGELRACRGSIDDVDRRRNHFGSDAVSRDYRHSVRLHGCASSRVAASCQLSAHAQAQLRAR